METFKSFISRSKDHAYIAVIYGAISKLPETIVVEEKLFTYIEKRYAVANGSLDIVDIWATLKCFYVKLKDKDKFLEEAISHVTKDQSYHLMQTIIFIYPLRFYNDGFINYLADKLEISFLNLNLLKEIVTHSLNKPCVVKYGDDSY